MYESTFTNSTSGDSDYGRVTWINTQREADIQLGTDYPYGTL